jgi:hypothetical protein
VWRNALITYRIFTSFTGSLFFIFEILTEVFIHFALRQWQSEQLLLSLTSDQKNKIFSVRVTQHCGAFAYLLQWKSNNYFYVYCWGKWHSQQYNDIDSGIKVIFWWICVAGNSEIYLGLLEKCPIFLSNFNQMWSFSTDIYKASKIKFYGNPYSESCAGTRTDMMKVTDAFRDYANPPNKALHEILNFPNRGLLKQNRSLWCNWNWKITCCVNFDGGGEEEDFFLRSSIFSFKDTVQYDLFGCFWGQRFRVISHRNNVRMEVLFPGS